MCTIDFDVIGSVWYCLVSAKYLSHLVGNSTMWFPNRSDKNQAAQSQKQARSLKFRILEEEEVY